MEKVTPCAMFLNCNIYMGTEAPEMTALLRNGTGTSSSTSLALGLLQ